MDIKRIRKALDILEIWYSAGTTQFVINLNNNPKHYYRIKLKYITMGLIQHDRYLNRRIKVSDLQSVSGFKQND